jgi:PKD repeat protein
MRHLTYIIIAIALLINGCKKKDPIETSESSVFSFSGKLNGNPVSYFSGVNDYYMYSSFTTDSNNVREFTGTLKPFTCVSGCKNSVTLRIRDYRTLSANPTDPDSSITTAFYTYAKPSGASSIYNVTFTPAFSGGTAQNYLWTFHDGSTSTSSAVVKTFPHGGQYTTSLSITSTSACTSSIYNTITFGQTGGVQLAIFNSAFGTAVSFTPNVLSGTSPFTYSWNFGDGNTSTTAFPTHTYSSGGAYSVSLTVTDFYGRTGTSYKNVGTQTPGTCLANYNYSSFGLSNPLNLSNIILEWTDANGITYTSDNNSQPALSNFRILSVEDYKLNENGEKTKKITVSANCTLYNGTSTVLLENAQLVFALAYP